MSNNFIGHHMKLLRKGKVSLLGGGWLSLLGGGRWLSLLIFFLISLLVQFELEEKQNLSFEHLGQDEQDVE